MTHNLEPEEDIPPCPECGSNADVVLVWEDPDAWAAGEDPSFIGCESCHIVHR